MEMTTLVLETKEIIPLLIGAAALKKMKARVNFATATLTTPKIKIRFKTSRSNLMYLPFKQLNYQQTYKHAMLTSVTGQPEKEEEINNKLKEEATVTLQDGQQKLIDKTTLKETIKQLHRELAHAGRRTCITALTQYAKIPNVNELVQEAIGACDICLKIKPKTGFEIQEGTLKSERPLEVIAADLIYYPESSEGHKYALTIQDQFTKYVVGVPLKERTAARILKEINQAWITPFQTPAAIRVDEGTEFQGEFKQFCEKNKIKIILSPTGRSQSNGMLERLHREIHIALRAAILESGSPSNHWHDLLASAISRINRRPNQETKLSPAAMLFNVTTTIPALDFLKEYQKTGSSRQAFFKKNEEVLFKHPKAKVPKLDVQWVSAKIIDIISSYV